MLGFVPLMQAADTVSGGKLPSDEAPCPSDSALSTQMVLRASVGALAGAAVAPKGREGMWAATGFFLGASLGQLGIVGIMLTGVWSKMK